MGSSMAELIALLAEKERAMEELVGALAEEQRCVVSLDLPALEENSRKKEAATVRLATLSGECGRLMGRAGAELGLAEVPSLSPLIAAAAPTEQVHLRPLQQRLVRLGRNTERQIRLNRRMLEGSLDLIRSSMALFARLLGGCDTYGAQGRITSGRARGSILCREI